MSDWKSRAKPVDGSSWKSRAIPVGEAGAAPDSKPGLMDELADYGKRLYVSTQTLAPRMVDAAMSGDAKALVQVPLAATQGLTLGHADEAVAGLESLGGAARDALLGRSEAREVTPGAEPQLVAESGPAGFYENLKSKYRGNRADWQRIFDESTHAEPGAEMAGGMLLPGPRAKGVLGRIAQAAGMGAVGGEGYSKKSYASDAAGVAKDAALGGVVGGATHGLFEGAGGALKKLGSAVQSGADEATLAAVGMDRRTIQGLAKNEGLEPAQIAQQIRDADLIPLLGSKKGMVSRAEAAMEQHGPTIRKIAQEAGDAPADALRARMDARAAEMLPVDRNASGYSGMMERLLGGVDELRPQPKAAPAPMPNAVDDLVDPAAIKKAMWEPTPVQPGVSSADFVSSNPDPTRAGRPSAVNARPVAPVAPPEATSVGPSPEMVPVEKLWETRSGVLKQLRQNPMSESGASQARRDVEQGLKSIIDEAVMGKLGPEKMSRLRSARQQYAINAAAAEAAGQSLAQKPGLGMFDVMSMGSGATAGAASGDPVHALVGGVGMPLLTRALRNRGPALAAPLLNAGAKGIGAAGGATQKAGSQAATTAARSALSEYFGLEAEDSADLAQKYFTAQMP